MMPDGPRIGKFRELGFLHGAALGCEEDVTAGLLEIARRNDGGEFFIFLKAHEIVDGFSARGRRGFGNFVNLQPVNAALGREEQNVAVRGGHEEMLDEIVVARLRADAALAAARLVTIGFHRSALDVAGMADGDGHFLVFDQVFELDFLDAVNDLRAALVAIGFQDFAQLGDDHGFQLLFAVQDFFEFLNALAQLRQFLQDFVDRQLRQAVQLQFEDRVDLRVGEPFALGRTDQIPGRGDDAVFLPVDLDAFDGAFLAADHHANIFVRKEIVQILTGIRAAGGPADDLDHVVDVVERDAVADQDVLALAGFAQFVGGAPADDVHAVLDEKAQQFEQAEFARLAGDDREQNHAERFLHLGHLEQFVQDDLRLFVALHFDDDAHAVAVAFVANVGDAINLFVLDQARDVFDQARFVDLIRQLGDDDVLAVLAALFDGGLGAYLERAAAGFVGLFDAFAAVDVAGGGKIRAGNQLHHFFQIGVGLFDQQDGGFDDFLQIVRRNVGGHAHGDTGGTVDQQIRNARGENDRLVFALIEVRDKINGLLLDVREHFFRDFREARFGVTHRGRGIAVHRAEIALAIHERVAHVEFLRQAHERVVDRRVTVRMELAENFADDLGAFAIGLRGGEAKLVHAEKDAAVHRLEAVAHVRQRAPDDYAHRVIEIRLLHLRFDIYRSDD